MFDALKSLLTKYKELLLYVFYGVLAAVVNGVTFLIVERLLGVPTLIANVISWIAGTTFAYLTNRAWVFTEKAHGWKAVLVEVASFAVGRVLTLGVEEIILWVGVDVLLIDSIPVKLFDLVFVGILNYVISKLVVFRERS